MRLTLLPNSPLPDARLTRGGLSLRYGWILAVGSLSSIRDSAVRLVDRGQHASDETAPPRRRRTPRR